MLTRHLFPKLYQIDLEQDTKKFKVRNQLMTYSWHNGKLYVLTRCFGDLRNIEQQQDISHKLYIEVYDENLKQVDRRIAPVYSGSVSFKIVGYGDTQFVISDDCIFSLFNDKYRLIVDPQMIGAGFLHAATICLNGRFLLVSFDAYLAVVRINDDGLEVASRLAYYPLKALINIGEDEFIGLAPEFTDSENETTKIHFYYFSATRMDLKKLSTHFYADYCANEESLDINMQYMMIKSTECEVNLDKKAFYLTYGKMRSIPHEDQPELIMPCLACIDVSNKEYPQFNYAISSVGVVLACAVSPFMMRAYDDYSELVAISDSFGFLSLCFGTCRFQDHRILYVNCRMAIKQITFGCRDAVAGEDTAQVCFLREDGEVEERDIYRYCFITLLGESDVPYTDEGHLLFAKTNYTIISYLRLDLRYLDSINRAPTAVAQQAEINGEVVDEFSNFDVEIPQLEQESHCSCDEDNMTTIQQGFLLIKERIIRRLYDQTCTINNDDSFENIDVDPPTVEKSISRLIGQVPVSPAPIGPAVYTYPGAPVLATYASYSVYPAAVSIASASTTTVAAPAVIYAMPAATVGQNGTVASSVQIVYNSNQIYPAPVVPLLECPRAYQLDDGDSVEFVKLLQYDDDNCYVMKLGDQFIVVGGQPSVMVIAANGEIVLGTANGLLYFLYRAPLRICAGPLHLGHCIVGVGVQEITSRMYVNEVSCGIFENFYAITTEQIFKFADKKQMHKLPYQIDCGSFLTFKHGLLGINQQIVIVTERGVSVFPTQALISLGSDFYLVQSVLWNSVIPHNVLKRFQSVNQVAKINYKVYDVLKSDTEVKDIMISGAIQLLLQWAITEAKEFYNYQVLKDCLKWLSEQCKTYLFASIVDALNEQDEGVKTIVEEWVKSRVSQ